MARAMSVCVSLHYGCIRLRNGDLFLYDDSLWAPIVCLAIPVRSMQRSIGIVVSSRENQGIQAECLAIESRIAFSEQRRVSAAASISVSSEDKREVVWRKERCKQETSIC